MNISSIFSARNVTLVVFILVVLVLGTVFNTHVGPEGMKESAGADTVATATSPSPSTTPKKTP